MSAETMEWLASHIRIGYTDERGPAWWARENYMTDGSHFDGPVPDEEIRRILAVPFVEAEVFSQYTAVDHIDGCTMRDPGECECPTRREVVKDPSKKSIVSPDDGHVHGYFSDGWQLHGYQEWTADKIASILDASRGELGCASVGLLKKRSVVFMQAKLTGTGLEVGGYQAVPFIGAATSVNGSLASTYFTGMEGVVCDNTLSAGLASALTKTKVKHTRYSAGRVAEIQSALSLVYEAGDAWQASAAELQAIDVTDADFRAWLDEISPVPAADPKSSTGGAKYSNAVKFRDRLTELWSYDPKVKPWAGTAFGIMQLGNTYRTWDRNVSGADGARMERNMLNMVTGIAAKEDAGDLDALAKVLARRTVHAVSA